MGILTKEVEIRVNGYIVEYYESLGYNIPKKRASKEYYKKTKKEFVYDFNKTILVKLEDLKENSDVYIDVLCDSCKKEVISVRYADYNKVIRKTGDYTCRNCSYLKSKQTSIKLYGDIYMKTDNFLQKRKNTLLKKYGYQNPMQSPEIKAKANETLCKNGTQKTSKQQLYLHSLYGGAINYPISCYASDICFPKEKIVIEYDGGGHNLRVTFGRLTQKEFEKKELYRNIAIKREGYKQMRIISTKDFLPSDDILLQMLEHARQYFSIYPNHSWIEFNIDASTVRNAEQKDGVFFDYGELRKVKKSDIVDIKCA